MTIDELMKIVDYVNGGDVVEIVRCRNCRHWDACEKFSGYCDNIDRMTMNDFFCADGEAKTNAAD